MVYNGTIEAASKVCTRWNQGTSHNQKKKLIPMFPKILFCLVYFFFISMLEFLSTVCVTV